MKKRHSEESLGVEPATAHPSIQAVMFYHFIILYGYEKKKNAFIYVWLWYSGLISSYISINSQNSDGSFRKDFHPYAGLFTHIF